MVAAAFLSLASEGVAQDVLIPADAIRVIEKEDRLRGEIVRVVVADLWPSEVLRVQVALADAGFDPGIRTARLDAPTRRALHRFQLTLGFRICGCLDYETLVALAIPPRVVDIEHDAIASSRSHSDLIILLPQRSHRHKRAGSGVFVGHAPAIGTGQAKKARDRRIEPRSSVGVREPPPPKNPSRIRAGSR